MCSGMQLELVVSRLILGQLGMPVELFWSGPAAFFHWLFVPCSCTRTRSALLLPAQARQSQSAHKTHWTTSSSSMRMFLQQQRRKRQ
jgi:hypothetical protein